MLLPASTGYVLAGLAAGALAFYVSDMFLAQTAFLGGGPLNTVLGYPIYYAACLLFACSILTGQSR